MSKSIPGNQKHLTLDNRILIEKSVDTGVSLRQIAIKISKDPSTIAKELKRNRVFQPHNSFNESFNKCALISSCTKKNICGTYAPVCKRQCKRCKVCNSRCSDFTPRNYHCPKLDKAPFVCNGCKKKSSCRLDKAYYRSASAHRDYRTILVESRVGLNISKENLTYLDEIITPLIKQGHSPYMILQNHPEITLSEKTIYNYIESGAFSVKNADLPKKVKYKIRNVHKTEIVDTGIFEGRTYKDYQEFIKEYPDVRVTEMDTVVGCEGSHKVLLTLHFYHCGLMMAYLLDNKEASSVEAVFDSLEKHLGIEVFSNVFPLILTDRGGEFKHPEKIECGQDNFIRTQIYYCDPMCSWQKPHCEKNHEYIRKICPKGTSFDDYTQTDINLIMSHINSTPRESLGGLSPFTLAKLMLPKELLECFGLNEVPSDEVILTPALMKK